MRNKHESRWIDSEQVKKTWGYQFYMANEVLIGNTIILLCGYWMVKFLFASRFGAPVVDDQIAIDSLGIAIRVLSILVISILILWYEIPIRKSLKAYHAQSDLDPNILNMARRRVLNEPYIIALIDAVVWSLGAILFWYAGSTVGILIGLGNGLITVTFVFLWLEHSSQHTRIPVFFPQGGLSQVPGAKSISVRRRYTALIIAVSLVPLTLIITTTLRFRQMRLAEEMTLVDLVQLSERTIAAEGIIFLIIAIVLSILVVHHLTPPIQELIQAMDNVKEGNFAHKAKVFTKDEIGLAAETLNEMSTGLQERERLQNSINIAQEVQQLLLPRGNPRIPGIDIAGRSIFCEETGGDYYDFLQLGPEATDKIGVVVGDVSGHGIGSALFMSMARTLLRVRSRQPGTLSQILTDVNHELANDLEDSGQFMTLFYLTLDTKARKANWVRAGHDPALLYDPLTDTFDELRGSGIPLGVDASWRYPDAEQRDLAENQIILIGTDGIWEAQNADGEMLGKDPIHTLIRKNAHKKADQIVESLVAGINTFQSGYRSADDITLVIVKT